MFRVHLYGVDVPLQRDTLEFPIIPRAGDYIELSARDFFRVVSVHLQPSYDGVGLLVERVSEARYDAIRGQADSC